MRCVHRAPRVACHDCIGVGFEDGAAAVAVAVLLTSHGRLVGVDVLVSCACVVAACSTSTKTARKQSCGTLPRAYRRIMSRSALFGDDRLHAPLPQRDVVGVWFVCRACWLTHCSCRLIVAPSARACVSSRAVFASQWSNGMMPHETYFSASTSAFPGPSFWQVGARVGLV